MRKSIVRNLKSRKLNLCRKDSDINRKAPGFGYLQDEVIGYLGLSSQAWSRKDIVGIQSVNRKLAATE